jgi:penicillin-binding protein 2
MINAPPEERVGPMTPQLALRVAIVGTFALAMFAIIFFRLWFLQVLTGDQYAKAAQVNYIRHIAIAAPRGQILDSSGAVMVNSTPVNTVTLQPAELPTAITTYNYLSQPPADMALYRRLAKILQLSTKKAPCPVAQVPSGVTIHLRVATIPCAVAQQVALEPYGVVTVATDVPSAVFGYLAERQEQFPGVTVGKAYLTQYPLSTEAAQVLGTVGPVSATELQDRQRNHGVSPQDIVGQSGLEWEYDQYLRGVDGFQDVKVNSQGQFEGYAQLHEPLAGHNLRTSLDLQLQQVGQAALAQSIASNPPANGGAFVALNPVNGQVYAMGSLPSYDPSVFTKFLPVSTYDQLISPTSGHPLINRAIQSAGPTGSTFKPLTATAAMESGAWSPTDYYDDTGQYCFSASFCLHNAGHVANGTLDIEQALKVSSDVFFYHLGALTNVNNPFAQPNGGALQRWASAYGIGRPTGIDLPGEATGTRPTPAWRAHRNLLEHECETATGPFKGHPKHPASAGGCGIAVVPPESWTIGDNVNMAVGQGDVQVTPLQLAVAYSAIANGGTVVTPHIGVDIESPDGTVLQKLSAPSSRHLTINSYYLDTIRAGLRAAASQPGGTSADVFGTFPEQVYGKTGTAQYNGQQDYSWYACFVPAWATSKPIAVVVWVEQGGFGAVAAAPVAREILSQWFFGHRGAYVAGNSRTL